MQRDAQGFRRPAALGLALAMAWLVGLGNCNEQEIPQSGAQLFDSPQVNAIALNADGTRLVVANTTSGTVSVFDTAQMDQAPDFGLLAEIFVGLDPVGVAFRPKAAPTDPELVLVTNHISDSISVVDLGAMGVVQTLQELDVDGVNTTDAPTGVVFSSPWRAFVTLDDRNEVLVLDVALDFELSINPQRLPITAQAPRAMAAANGKLYVASFESGNMTEFPTCGQEDHVCMGGTNDGILCETNADIDACLDNGGLCEPPGVVEGAPHDEGCSFPHRILDSIFINAGDPENPFDFQLGTIFDFAADNPNIGGRVVIDRDLPDRDLYVFDAQALGAPLEMLEHLGTLHYGLAAAGSRLFITQTEARNHLEGLNALDGRMFENRLAIVDCGGDGTGCSLTDAVDLDANAAGPAGAAVPVPTPYGVQVSANGQSLVVSVAGSDGVPGTHGNPAVDIPGLVTLDADGNLLGFVQTGAIPQSVALASDGAGAAQTAYVLNAVDSSVSVVDVSNLANPTVVRTIVVGDDPTPPDVRNGRELFMSARASTRGTFSCESCHPNSNTDQLLWVINANTGPDDFVPECDVETVNCPEPRTTMPIRGLRDTLPLHWAGNLGDPILHPDEPAGGGFIPEDDEAPDCDIENDGELSCFRDLSDASLSGVMCDPLHPGGCPTGPSGLLGALTDAERNDLAAFMASVAYPPSPKRRPDDSLTAMAIQGVADFFTDLDGLGIGSPNDDTIGSTVGFAPITCADNSGGCHTLPLGHSTNSQTVGRFDAPGMRGIWDRFVIFSNGLLSSEEVLRQGQSCADGVYVGLKHTDPSLVGAVTGDPCALDSFLLEVFLGGAVDPFLGVPSGEQIWDPAVGMTERGSFMVSMEVIFHLAYGVRGAPMWEFFNEMSVGLPGLTGRQLSITVANADDADTLAALAQIEEAATLGKITAVARLTGGSELRFKPASGLWVPVGGGVSIGSDALRNLPASLAQVVTVTAELPANVSIGGPDRQPLLDVDPDERVAEEIGDLLAIPEPLAAGGSVVRLGAWYVDPQASVLVNGALCGTCSFVPGSGDNGDYIDLTLAEPLPPGVNVVQVLNPNGLASNEMPVIARAER